MNNDYSYLAGTIDSDGNFHISRRERTARRSPEYQLVIPITSTKYAHLLGLQLDYGVGNVTRTRKAKGNDSAQYQWRIADKQAEKTTRNILPYIRLKRPQAELALYFRSLISKGPKPLSKENLEARENCYIKMKKLNAR